MNLPPYQRYQGKLFFGSSHSWALEQLTQLSPSTAVLDVGSGSGVIGAELRKKGFTTLCAVEVDESTREQTRNVYNEIAASIEAFKGRSFGAVILLDVLEHMLDPEEFLKSLLPLLSSGASILVSVPNVAHWSVRLPLLFGIFNYKERGILDKTHYRFFTRRSKRELLTAFPELSTTSEAVSIPPLQFVLPSSLCENPVFDGCARLQHHIAQLMPGFFGYQLLTSFKKRG